MIKIAICDDDNNELLKAEDFLKKYKLANPSISIEVYKFLNPIEMMEYIDKYGSFNIYILDIIMDVMKGIDVAKELKMRQDCGEIIFATNSKDYAIDAFSLNAVHYLIKPYDRINFYQAIDRAIKNISSKIDKYLVRNTDKGVMRINIKNICFTESSGHYQYIHIFNGDVLKIRSKTTELWDELKENKQFIIPHTGYIVNMEYVKKINSLGMEVNDITIPLSKNIYSKVKKIYMDYSFGQM